MLTKMYPIRREMCGHIMGDIKIPGLGNVKKSYAIAGGIGIVTIAGIAYWRHQANAAANAASTTTTDTTATDPNAIDLNTGIPYSQETAASYPSYPYGVSDYGGGTGYPYSPQPVSTSANGITTNADWATQAENDLLAQGVTIAASSTAISKVLAGLPVTVDQQNLFLQARGLLGDEPPQGYPKPIKLLDTPGQPAPTGTVEVPNVVGKNFGSAFNTLTVANLVSDPGHGCTNAAWIVTAQSVKPGTKVKIHTVVHLTVPKPKGAK